jgi:hypothetical protein
MRYAARLVSSASWIEISASALIPGVAGGVLSRGGLWAVETNAVATTTVPIMRIRDGVVRARFTRLFCRGILNSLLFLA